MLAAMAGVRAAQSLGEPRVGIGSGKRWRKELWANKVVIGHSQL